MPKFDRVIVAPRNSSGGIERAAASARMRSRPARKSVLSRSPTLRSTGTISPPSRSTAMPTSMRLSRRRSPASELYQALSDGSALQAAAMACTSRMVMSASFDHASMSTSSVTVVGTTWACATAMRCAIARRMPLSGSAGPASARLRAARSTSARVIIPPGPLPCTRLRSTSSLRASARIAGSTCSPRMGAGASSSRGAGSLRCDLADDRAGVRFGTLAEFDQRGADLDQIALGAEPSRDAFRSTARAPRRQPCRSPPTPAADWPQRDRPH